MPPLTITTPIFLPLVATCGLGPVHFRVILMRILGIGLRRPPDGILRSNPEQK